jgi:hypothetical protein
MADVRRNIYPPHDVSTAPPPSLQNRPAPTAIVVVAPPFAQYQARSGRRYAADERGEIATANADDAEDLLRAGCRREA